MTSFISDDNIEKALLQRLLNIHGFDVLDCATAKPEDLNDCSNRADKRDVIFPIELKNSSLELNADIPEQKIEEVIDGSAGGHVPDCCQPGTVRPDLRWCSGAV